VKLTPKPSPKDKSTSPESTSTKPIDRASSRTRKTRTILTNVEYTGTDQHGQAVPTAAQTAREKQKSTLPSIGIFFPAELDALESEEARILGTAISQMPWLRWYTDSPAVRLGVTQGEGEIEELGGRTIGQFDGAVLYRQTGNDDPAHTKMVRLEDVTQLKTFTTAAITELYRRGILV
jgi:hypothetical protein